MNTEFNNRIVALDPLMASYPAIAIAACRAKAIGILDFQLDYKLRHFGKVIAQFKRLTSATAQWGIRLDGHFSDQINCAPLSMIKDFAPPIIIFAGLKSADELEAVLSSYQITAAHLWCETPFIETAKTAEQLGFTAIVLKGHESGGYISDDTGLILCRKANEQLSIPFFIQGGIGLHSAPAAILAGATGVVLNEQLWLSAEARITSPQRAEWSRLDGSETHLLSHDNISFRSYARSGIALRAKLEQQIAQQKNWQETLANNLQADQTKDPILLMGQEIGLAKGLADIYDTTGRILQAIHRQMNTAVPETAEMAPLGEGKGLAKAHSTRYAIVQGPMTRVSDIADFAFAVANAGALPFLALALNRGEQCLSMLLDTHKKMGDRSWGTGILGFIPTELRKEQMAAIKACPPSFAIIAGGRPSLAVEFEKMNIPVYLHVPSPGLLKLFVKEGSRKFIFEGYECGGHVGPRSSYLLWDTAVSTLLQLDLNDYSDFHILFAGGISDPLSAAMAAVIASPLIKKGAQFGILMGTAYLMTPEAVASGAITSQFQEQARVCKQTTLLQSGTGHATRCADTPFAEDFRSTKDRLVRAGKDARDILYEMEALNIGRLRLASKGKIRNHPDKNLINVDAEQQFEQGLYMMGQVAELHTELIDISKLHTSVTTEAMTLLKAASATKESNSDESIKSEDIAIIGMAGIFAGAQNLKEYWENIVEAVDSVSEVDQDRWDINIHFNENRLAPDQVYSKWGGFIDPVPFEPASFGIPPNSLYSIEPMQILALKVSSDLMNETGYAQLDFPRERTSAIFGVGGIGDLASDYNLRSTLAHVLSKSKRISPDLRQKIMDSVYDELPPWTEDSFPGVLGNVVSGRVANRLDLGGPNFTVDAACASSLAAMEIAITQLRSGICDLAITGAIDGTNNIYSYMAFCKTHALSPAGRCKTFDDSADGTTIGEGVAALMLKRLSDAEKDGDKIYAVIKGVGSSSDGRNRSLTAPHPEGQMQAIRRAYADAHVSPGSIGLVEAHGTATAAGDVAEIKSISTVFTELGAKNQTCAIGSVKSMIGHTKVTAGMAGIIKCVNALQHQILPPTIGVATPNKKINFESTPFYINTEARPWIHHADYPRRAGISAFGFGGTNFHLVLEAYEDHLVPNWPRNPTPRPCEIFCTAAESPEALTERIRTIKQTISSYHGNKLDQLLASVQADYSNSTTASSCRLAIICSSVTEFKQHLCSSIEIIKGTLQGHKSNPKGIYYSKGAVTPITAFIFPGQGSQKTNMFRDLSLCFPEIRNAISHASKTLSTEFERPLEFYIYPHPMFSQDARQQQQAELNDTRIAQPAIGAVNMAAFDLLARFGITPDVVAGHSYGEYAALCAAKIITRQDLARISAIRGRIAHQTGVDGGGGMAAVTANASTVEQALKSFDLPVWLANLNAPLQTVIAGKTKAVDLAVTKLNMMGLKAKRIPVSGAFHTQEMSTAAQQLKLALSKLKFSSPSFPVFSNTLAVPFPSETHHIRDILSRHLQEPVRFEEEIRTIHKAGTQLFIECGPGRTLSSLVNNILGDADYNVANLDGGERSDVSQFGHLLCLCFTLGIDVNIDEWYLDRELSTLSLKAFLSQEEALANPGPSVWRITPAKSEPWNQPEQPISNRLSEDDDIIEIIEDQPMKNTYTTDPVMQQFLANSSQFLELQQANQRTAERFLELQSQTLAYLQGQGVVVTPSALETTQTVPSVTPNTVTNQFTPPAPVLPDFVINPSPTTKKTNTVSNNETEQTQAETELPTSINETPETPISAEEFQKKLLTAVSEKTGYPIEMLDLDVSMEADLGIDSIKKIEIFGSLGNFTEQLQIQDDDRVLEDLAELKTIRSIVTWYISNLDGQNQLGPIQASENLLESSSSPNSAFSLDQISQEASQHPVETKLAEINSEHDDKMDPVKRYVVKTVSLPTPIQSDAAYVLDDCNMLVLSDTDGFGQLICKSLLSNNIRPILVKRGKNTVRISETEFEADLSSLTSVKKLRELILKEGHQIGAILNTIQVEPIPEKTASIAGIQELFVTLKVFEPEIREGAGSGGLIVNISTMGGAFGLNSFSNFPLAQAGSIGMLKAIAREWREVRVKCIDIDPNADFSSLGPALKAEFENIDSEVEIGLSKTGRIKPIIEESPIIADSPSPIDIDSDSVILITGGADGITAEVALDFAKTYRSRLILVGRSVIDTELLNKVKIFKDPSGLRQHFIETSSNTKENVTPADIEQRVQKILKLRRIQENIKKMQDAGSLVEYFSLDVSKESDFAAFIESCYTSYGRIDGVIHGAGITDDHLVRDKTVKSFKQVMSTKINPAIILSKNLRQDHLKFVVFFSSVAARFGNAGQIDYSAANEILNKLASRLDREWDCHVVSIGWGPWDSGMVTPTLKQFYETAGIGLIPSDEGVTAFREELLRNGQRTPEVVISRSIDRISGEGLGKAMA